MTSRVIELDGEPFLITAHAQGRILDMCLDPSDVVACLTSPDEVTPSRKYPGSYNWRYADFTLGVHPRAEAYVVITAVWATQEAWVADFALTPYEDRQLRQHFSGRKART